MSALPERREEAKMRNVATRGLRSAIDPNKSVSSFGVAGNTVNEVFTGLDKGLKYRNDDYAFMK